MKNKLPPLNLGNETIGERIAKVRKKQGLTQTELAKNIGITQSLVSDYEVGRIHLADEMLARFSLALSVSSDYLLGLENTLSKESPPSLKIMRRLKKIEELPESDQKALFKTIDKFIY